MSTLYVVDWPKSRSALLGVSAVAVGLDLTMIAVEYTEFTVTGVVAESVTMTFE